MLGARPTHLAAIGAVFAAGAMLRGMPILGSAFPVNDGGMFQTMASELLTSGFSLPTTTGYNGASIPWAYPPLGLYVAAVLQWMGLAATDVLRLAPVAFSIATIPMVFLIGRALLGGWRSGLLTAAFFALSTGSYRWLVMGGGITRALGFLMALAAVYFAIRWYRGERTWLGIASGVALGATGLSHPQAAVFGAISVLLLSPFLAADWRRGLRGAVLIFATAAVVVSPWLLAVVSAHGLSPLLSAAGTGGPPLLGVVSLLSGRTSGGFLEVVGILTSLGLVVCGLRRYWLPIAWILAIAIADSRAGQPYIAVPAAIAIAFLLRDILRMSQRWIDPPDRARRYARALSVVLVIAAFGDSIASQGVPGSPLRSLSDDTREAMAWVASETEPGATFVVVSGWHWALDAEAEWFPALSRRTNLTTVQGTEWTGEFAQRAERAAELPRCIVANDQKCIQRWFAEVGSVDYLFLIDTPSTELAPALGAFECCRQLAEQVGGVYETEIVYRGDTVEIVRLHPLRAPSSGGRPKSRAVPTATMVTS